jgi:hypothetical protein
MLEGFDHYQTRRSVILRGEKPLEPLMVLSLSCTIERNAQEARLDTNAEQEVRKAHPKATARHT